ncbi:MAG: metal-sulfur cluster assembly factor [Polyangiaceae bacterium]|nr:metal-sulfur cluster assembly factor [Polyangiaceae bacterium]
MVDERDVMRALRSVVDPELGVNVVDLGLVYAVRLVPGHVPPASTEPTAAANAEPTDVEVDLAMTSAGCPLAGYLCTEAESAVRDTVPGVAAVTVRVVDDPPWSPDRMSDAARAILG